MRRIKNQLPACDFCGVEHGRGERWVWFQDENLFFCCLTHQSHYAEVQQANVGLEFDVCPQYVNTFCPRCAAEGRLTKMVKGGSLVFSDAPGNDYLKEFVHCLICDYRMVV